VAGSGDRPGFGSFAFLAKRAGFEVEAIEQDRSADYLATRVGVRVVKSASPAEVLAHTDRRCDAIVPGTFSSTCPTPGTFSIRRYAR
jgi:hypothetical protein